jgi:hypothetical protein
VLVSSHRGLFVAYKHDSVDLDERNRVVESYRLLHLVSHVERRFECQFSSYPSHESKPKITLSEWL